MHLKLFQQKEFNQDIAYIGHEALMTVATVLFWMVMLGLLSCPVWLPSLIERSFAR